MKTKRVLIIVTINLVFITTNLVAQPRNDRMTSPPPPDSIHIQKMVDEMEKELSLTVEQKKEISTIFLTQMKAGKKKRDLMEAKRIEENRQVRKEVDEKVKAVLNEEQAMAYVLFEEKHRKERCSDLNPEPRPDR